MGGVEDQSPHPAKGSISFGDVEPRVDREESSRQAAWAVLDYMNRKLAEELRRLGRSNAVVDSLAEIIRSYD